MIPIPKLADKMRIYIANEKLESEEVLETLLENREEEEAAGGTTRLAHAADATTKGGCHTEGLFFRETIEGGESGHDTLRTIIAALEEFNGAGNTLFHVLHLDIQIIWVIFAELV